MAINQFLDSTGAVQRQATLNSSNELVILDSADAEVMDLENHGADGDHGPAGSDPIPAKGLNSSQLNMATGSSSGTGAQQTLAHGLTGTPAIVILTPTAALAAAADAPFRSAASDATNIYVTAGSGKAYAWAAIV